MPVIFIFNFLGLAMLAVSAVLFVSLNGLVTTAGAGMIAAGLAVVMDLGWRSWRFLAKREETETESEAMQFVSPRNGGNLMLLPVWIIGMLGFFFSGQLVFQGFLKF